MARRLKETLLEIAAANDADALELRRLEIEAELATLKGTLEETRTKAYETGEYADREWYKKASFAQRAMGAEHQAINRRLAAIRRQNAPGDWQARFVKLSRQRLSADLFEEILAESKAV